MTTQTDSSIKSSMRAAALHIGVLVRFVQKVALSHALPNPLLLRG